MIKCTSLLCLLKGQITVRYFLIAITLIAVLLLPDGCNIAKDMGLTLNIWYL